ncbi:Uncharacterised protein [uncultured Clostridium sp.]|nr:Uncharacterised protein [uncultured Clostridium sp.]
MPTKKPRISITLEPETYRQISNMAKKENKDYCAIIGLNQKDLENQGILA